MMGILVLRRFVPALLLAVLPASTVHGGGDDNSFAVRNVRLFDGERVTERANVVVIGGLITAAGPDAPLPPGVPVIDGGGKTLVPGLIDSHVHVFAGAQEDALRFGVTTEIDMFTLAPRFAPWRSQRETLPRTRAADTWSAGLGVSAPGGHPSGTMPGSETIETLAPGADADAFVAARVAEGSDFIKIIVEDNSVLSPGHPIPALAIEDACAAVRAAHRYGKLAIVHASRARDALSMVECGADGLAHLFADEVASADFIRLARDRRIFVVSTLAVLSAGSGEPLAADLYGRPAFQDLLSPAQKQVLALGFGTVRPQGIANALQSARLLHAAGVPLLAGTDAPNPGAPHGAGLQAELVLLTRAGLTPAQALEAATALPARTFGLADRGRIAPGRRADLVLVDGDPLHTIGAALAIDTIWKNGFVVSREPR